MRSSRNAFTSPASTDNRSGYFLQGWMSEKKHHVNEQIRATASTIKNANLRDHAQLQIAWNFPFSPSQCSSNICYELKTRVSRLQGMLQIRFVPHSIFVETINSKISKFQSQKYSTHTGLFKNAENKIFAKQKTINIHNHLLKRVLNY